ncbi:MAG: hypothetical protein R2749_17700 [Acidimicrobiales bacterium]
MDFGWLSDPSAWSALAALLTLEVVLGVDNVVFISILASKLPADQQDRARRVGILAAGGMRVVLLLAAAGSSPSRTSCSRWAASASPARS